MDAPEKKVSAKKVQSVESSLKELNVYIKQLAAKKDLSADTATSLKHVTRTMSVMLDKLSALSKQKKIKAWDVVVYRGKDKLIRSLKLSAGE